MSENAVTDRPTNRLAGETSPYLLQHAHNPVDWYPWGPEALERAHREDRPILLSIGYSACHWCHVMERESFEDPATAALMNQHFVSIKVDREERPDLDGIYMQAVQALTGQGGWPMTVFLTPDGKPFWGGTYFPPEDRHGLPSFKRVLASIAGAWESRRDEVLTSGAELAQHLQQQVRVQPGSEALSADVLDTASRNLLAQFDRVNGGFGRAPKFPQPMAIEFLLRQWHRTGAPEPLEAASANLEAMARGGVYDHLGGGFHRYSVDDHWLVPHFEKMLYDNAQLARAYLMGYQATGNAFFREIAEQTLYYVLRDMTDPSGGFYSTEDADSEGEEGKFYVWRPSELVDLLGEEDGRLFAAYYDASEPANFERGASILHAQATPDMVAQRLGVPEARLLEALERGRPLLLAARERRVRPGRDDKVLAAWNGMMLRAFAEAARVLDRGDYLDAAVRNGGFLLNEMRDRDGRLRRTWKPGHAARLNGYLEDYANVADGLLALYEATFDARWLAAARQLVEAILARFADVTNGGFFDTSSDHEVLVTRPKELFDNATPSGTSVAVDVLLRLALLTGIADYERHARRALEVLAEPAARYPLGFARLLSAMDFHLSRPKEIAIVGEPGRPETQALVSVVYERFLPNKVVAGAAPNDPESDAIPLLQERGALDGKPTAYVCEQYVCLAPVASPAELRAQLEAA